MTDKELFGRLVYLTPHADHWIRDSNPGFNIPMANRIARVVKVFDWDTEEGKYLLSEREKSGKWGKFDPKDFKFVLTIFYPELVKDGKTGLPVEEVMPRYYPGGKLLLFDVLPEWMRKEFSREVSKDRTFKLVPKD